MTVKKRSPAIQTALIGLLGSVLTVIGGLCGASISSLSTIYELKRQSQRIDVAAPVGGQSLSIDTGSIFLTRQEAAALDSNRYYVDFERGFVLHRPLVGWNKQEEITVGEQLADEKANCQGSTCTQPVFRIRYGAPIEIESDRKTQVNGQPIPNNLLDISEQLYGLPPWKGQYYSQILINYFSKEVVLPLGMRNLSDMTLQTIRIYEGRINRIIASNGSQFIIIQGSTSLDGIRVNGNPTSITIDRWLLFAEAENAFYTVEIQYMVQSGQPLQVWDDLQTYVESFRVIK